MIEQRTITEEPTPPPVENLEEARAEITRLVNEKNHLIFRLRLMAFSMECRAAELRQVAEMIESDKADFWQGEVDGRIISSLKIPGGDHLPAPPLT